MTTVKHKNLAIKQQQLAAAAHEMPRCYLNMPLAHAATLWQQIAEHHAYVARHHLCALIYAPNRSNKS